MSYNDRALVGVHGWLAFLVVILGALGPIGSLVSVTRDLYESPQVATYFGDRYPLLQAYEWGLCLMSVCGSGYLAWRLSKVHTAATPRVVIAGLWLLALAPPLANAIALRWIAPRGAFGDTAGVMMAQIGRPVIWAAIWTAYLLMSRRVANTYTGTADPELGLVFE